MLLYSSKWIGAIVIVLASRVIGVITLSGQKAGTLINYMTDRCPRFLSLFCHPGLFHYFNRERAVLLEMVGCFEERKWTEATHAAPGPTEKTPSRPAVPELQSAVVQVTVSSYWHELGLVFVLSPPYLKVSPCDSSTFCTFIMGDEKP